MHTTIPNFHSGSRSKEKSAVFSLVDPNGAPALAKQHGLLLYKGGKVCSRGFTDTAANYICSEIGFSGAKSWFSGYYFALQDDLKVTLRETFCTNDGRGNPCTWDETEEKCPSNKNVFLTCKEGCQI